MIKLLAVLVLVGCTSAAHQTYRRAALVGVIAASACDFGQTLNLSDQGRWGGSLREQNPLLGSSPGPARMLGFGAGTVGALVILLENDHVPELVKDTVASLALAAEVYNVHANAKLAGAGNGWCGQGPSYAR